MIIFLGERITLILVYSNYFKLFFITLNRKEKCSESQFATFQALCNSKASCTVYGSSYTLSTCLNAKSDYLLFDYNCVPG